MTQQRHPNEVLARFGSALPLLLIGLALVSAAGITIYFVTSGASDSAAIQPILAETAPHLVL